MPPVNYNPDDAVQCWPKDEYDAVLVDVKDQTSKKGDPMQLWSFECYHADGRSQTVKDYVVIPAATWKIGQLAKALGKSQDFKDRRFQAEDYLNSGVRVQLVIEEQEGFEPRNKIGKIMTKVAGKTQAATNLARTPTDSAKPHPSMGNNEVEEDEIPF